MKKFLLFVFMLTVCVGAWAVDEIKLETSTSASFGKLDFSAYELEIFDTDTDRWSNYEIGVELGTDLKDDLSVFAGFEYYEARASKEDSSMSYGGLSFAATDWMKLKVIYRYHWNQEDEDSDDFKYGPVFSFDLPFDISISDCSYFYSRPRRNSHSYLNEFDLSKTLFSWGDDEENSLSLLLGEEIYYSFDTDLLDYALFSTGFEMVLGSATASIEYYFEDKYHNPYDKEWLEIKFAWDF